MKIVNKITYGNNEFITAIELGLSNNQNCGRKKNSDESMQVAQRMPGRNSSTFIHKGAIF